MKIHVSGLPGAWGGAGGVWVAPGAAGCIPGTAGPLAGADGATDDGATDDGARDDGARATGGGGWPETAALVAAEATMSREARKAQQKLSRATRPSLPREGSNSESSITFPACSCRYACRGHYHNHEILPPSQGDLYVDNHHCVDQCD